MKIGILTGRVGRSSGWVFCCLDVGLLGDLDVERVGPKVVRT